VNAASTPGSNLGRHGFGVAALAFGLITLAWPDIYDWLQPRTLIASGGANTFGGGFDDELTGNQARRGREGRRVL